MILEFRVRNFRSFLKEAVFSLVASKDHDLAETNTVSTAIRGIPRAVRTAVIYGANASGKSNLILAILYMRSMISESAKLQPSQNFNAQPFRLNEESVKAPTLLEMTVLINGIRYQYGFEFTAERIVSEWLLVYKSTKPQKWIDRYIDANGNEVIDPGANLAGQKNLWKEATRHNSLFLSTAVQLNSEQLRPLSNWFQESLVIFLAGGHIAFDFSTASLQDKTSHDAITSLLSAADIGIESIAAVQQKSFFQTIQINALTGKSDASGGEREMLLPRFRHAAGNVRADFEYADESEGTQKLFSLASPILDILKRGRVLVIDELDRSFHPLLVRKIVEVFQDPQVNENGAQLIFTTHDTSLLDSNLLRRDQIWLTEKQSDQSSELLPLTTFSPRKGEALAKAYLSGRYGAVPILRETLVPPKPRRG